MRSKCSTERQIHREHPHQVETEKGKAALAIDQLHVEGEHVMYINLIKLETERRMREQQARRESVGERERERGKQTSKSEARCPLV